MKKLNSLIYLFYYLLLWVVLPATGLGEQVFASEFGESKHYSFINVDAHFSDFQHCVNPDWNRITRQDSQDNLLLKTGHWPVLFSSVFKPRFRFSTEEILNTDFSNVPVLGTLTIPKIIFPFHYFW